MRDRFVEFFNHIEEKVTRMLAHVAFIEDGVYFEYFGEFVNGIDGVVSCCDEKIFSNEEINLLIFVYGIGVLECREVEDEINKVRIGVHFWLECRCKEFVCCKWIYVEFIHNRTNFTLRWGLHVNPRQIFMRVSRNHIYKVYTLHARIKSAMR